MKTLIFGGHVIDPANGIDAIKNILIEDGKIAALCDDRPQADQVIDATGMTVTPGFIDIHLHEDPMEGGEIQQCIFHMMLRQGVTTAVGGNCGILA